MQSVEIHQMACGECIVLRGANKDILMVDCGETASGGVSEILKRYSGTVSRDFLLTHFHGDGLRSLEHILKGNPNYFDRIFLPVSPCDKRGRPLLLEFALFVFAFLDGQDDYFYENTVVLRIFDSIAKKADATRIFALGSNSSFRFDNVEYDVLWPAESGFPFSDLFAAAVEDMNVCLSSPFLPEAAGEFLRLKEQFCTSYLACCRTVPLKPDGINRMMMIFNKIEKIKPELRRLPSAPDVVEILDRPATHAAYDGQQRAASVIFHNRRKSEASTDDILMAGAAAPESIDAISEELYDGYYILKAPQHGTAGAWNHLFGEIGASHILISNGNNRQEKTVAAEYTELPAIKHCTDCSGCFWFINRGCSCNRLNCCYDLCEPGLTIKCAYCQNAENHAPCGIYIISSNNVHSCICDNKPININ